MGEFPCFHSVQDPRARVHALAGLYQISVGLQSLQGKLIFISSLEKRETDIIVSFSLKSRLNSKNPVHQGTQR